MAEISIAKHRNGSLADIPLRFIGKFAKFTDPEDNIFGNMGSMPDAGIPTNHDFDYASNSGIPKTPNTYTLPSKMNDDSFDTPF
jgi:replicative DNA helicase